MRIAAWYNLPSGGAKRALHDQVQGLTALGHEVEVWCPPTANRSFLDLSDIAEEHVVPLGTEGVSPPWSSGRLGPLRTPMRLARAMSAHAKACAAQIDAGGFDVCLVSTCQFFGAPPIGRYLRAPSALFLQEPNRWLYEANPEFPWLARGPHERSRWLQPARSLLELVRIHRRSQRARFEVDNAKAFDRVLVNSLFSRETVLRVYGIDARVCYLGVDTSVFRRTGADREEMVVGVGAIAPFKNPELLIEAISRLSEPRPVVAWVGAGKDEAYAARLHAMAAERNVALEVHENAGDDTLVQLLNRARVLAYTSRLEPFGLVPLEANACELPVVAVAEGGIRETVVDEQTGLLVEPRPQELAAGIERLLKDPDLAERLGSNGHTIVEGRWTNEQATLRLEEELLSVVHRNRGS